MNQEALAQYLHEHDPLIDESSRWEAISEAERNAYRAYAYNALMFLHEALPTPVFPTLYRLAANG
jgi:hypothetical protein